MHTTKVSQPQFDKEISGLLFLKIELEGNMMKLVLGGVVWNKNYSVNRIENQLR
jgi:hypothetical protein